MIKIKLNRPLKFIISILICQSAGLIGSVFTAPAIGSWYKILQKPAINPPNWIFAPVWTLLFFLMGVSFYLVWEKGWKVSTLGEENKKQWNSISQKLWTGAWKEENVISIFILQLVLNTWWSVIFFGLKMPGLAFFELLALWVAILYTIINFYRISKIAAYLLIPYILWVSFAGVLNFLIWQINLNF